MIEKEIEIKTSEDFYNFLEIQLIKYHYKNYTGFHSKQQVYINVTDNKKNDYLLILNFICSYRLFKALFKHIRNYDIKKQIEENRKYY